MDPGVGGEWVVDRTSSPGAQRSETRAAMASTARAAAVRRTTSCGPPAASRFPASILRGMGGELACRGGSGGGGGGATATGAEALPCCKDRGHGQHTVAAQDEDGVRVGADGEARGVSEVEAVVAGAEAPAHVVGEQLRLAVEEHRGVVDGGLPRRTGGCGQIGTRRGCAGKPCA